MIKISNPVLLLQGLLVLASFGLPSDAVAQSRPNVLFISIDDLNDWEGSMGGNSQAKTPNMDKLFAQGMLFTNAHCSQAVCTASRNSVLSGLHPSTSGWYVSTTKMRETYDQVMGDHKMLPQHFKDNGYETLAVGKVFHQGVSDYRDRTDDFWSVTGPKYKVPKKFNVDRYGPDFADGHSLCYGALDPKDIPGGKMYDEMIAEWAVEQLESDHDKPFFLAVGFVRPHVPFTAPRKYFDMYDLDEIRIPEVPEDEMSDIPVVLWSDHGQHLGEKKHWRKQALWEEATRVPLCFKVPGVTNKESRSTQPVSLLDLYPTLVDLCELPEAPKLDGNSLVPLLEDPSRSSEQPVVMNWYYQNYAVRSHDWRYIQYRDGTEELYDHRADPNEHKNLAGEPEHSSVIAEHRKWLPSDPALPAGSKKWKGDKLDRRIKKWKANDSLPDWLK